MLDTPRESKDVLIGALSYKYTSARRRTNTYIHHLRADTGCNLEDLLRPVNNSAG